MQTTQTQHQPQPVGGTGAFGVDAPTAQEIALARQVGAKFYAVARMGGAQREFLSFYCEPADRARVERATAAAGHFHSSCANAAGHLSRIDVLREDVERGGTYIPD